MSSPRSKTKSSAESSRTSTPITTTDEYTSESDDDEGDENDENNKSIPRFEVTKNVQKVNKIEEERSSTIGVDYLPDKLNTDMRVKIRKFINTVQIQLQLDNKDELFDLPGIKSKFPILTDKTREPKQYQRQSRHKQSQPHKQSTNLRTHKQSNLQQPQFTNKFKRKKKKHPKNITWMDPVVVVGSLNTNSKRRPPLNKTVNCPLKFFNFRNKTFLSVPLLKKRKTRKPKFKSRIKSRNTKQKKFRKKKGINPKTTLNNTTKINNHKENNEKENTINEVLIKKIGDNENDEPIKQEINKEVIKKSIKIKKNKRIKEGINKESKIKDKTNKIELGNGDKRVRTINLSSLAIGEMKYKNKSTRYKNGK